MKSKAAPHVDVKNRPSLRFLGLLMAMGTVLLWGAAGAAAASPVGKDGRIHACYRVKGKPKGGLRIVLSAKSRCKKGERKVAWSAAGFSGGSGASGQSGSSGSGSSGAGGENGVAGTNGAAGANEKALEAKVASLAVKVNGLEDLLQGVGSGDLAGAVGTLNGVTNGELTGAVATLDGLTNAGLTKAVNGVPALNSLCTQASQLTGGLNSLNTGIGGISVLGFSGLSLNTASLPETLSPYACPAH